VCESNICDLHRSVTEWEDACRIVACSGVAKHGPAGYASLIHVSHEAVSWRAVGSKGKCDQTGRVNGGVVVEDAEGLLEAEAAHLRFNYGPNVMGKMLQTRAKENVINPKYIVVDDGTNVLDCRVLGNYRLIQITRDSVERVYPFMIPNAHVVIRNNGSIAELEVKMKLVADKLEEDK
jgi:hypothetical protein